MKNELLRYAKALGSGAVSALGFLIAVTTADPTVSNPTDLSFAQWLGVLLAFLTGAGITAAIPKGDELARIDRHGVVRAGPAARQDTGDALGGGTPVVDLVRDQDSRGVGR